jgi:anti-anti-sigma factor
MDGREERRMAVEALEQRPVGEGPVLTVGFRHIGPICLLSLRGALHAGSLSVLEAQFDRLGRTTCNRVVVDLTDVTGLDTTGARVLIGLRHYVHARGGRLTLIGTNRSIRGTLDDAETTHA